MKDFVNYISPSSEEIVTRNNVISTLKKEIGKFWPGTETHVLGRVQQIYIYLGQILIW